jgi:hypothetical protein
MRHLSNYVARSAQRRRSDGVVWVLRVLEVLTAGQPTANGPGRQLPLNGVQGLGTLLGVRRALGRRNGHGHSSQGPKRVWRIDPGRAR